MAQDTTDKTRTIPGAQAQNHEEHIRHRAYQFYEARGKEGGQALDDWLRAESEITPQQQKTRTIAA